MNYIIDEKREKELLHCVYVGSYIMSNGLKKGGEKYEEFAEEVYKQALAARGMSGTDREISELRDRIIDGVSKAFETYEARMIFERWMESIGREE